MSIAEKLIRQKQDFDDVYEAGEKAEYDAFWDAYQNYGYRTDYATLFTGTGWKYGTSYKPKYPLIPTSAQQMYYGSNLQYEALKDVDFSNCTEFYQAFSYSYVAHLGIIDFRKASRVTQAFLSCIKLHTIDKLIVSETTPMTTNVFQGCTAFANLVVEGVFGATLSFVDCTVLSRDSIVSVVNALSTAVSGKTVTFSKTAVNTAFETSVGAGDGSTSEEWLALANTKTNWTINLV